MGHMGVDRTLYLVRSRFYWPKMSADVEKKVKTCERCVKRKAVPEKSAPLVNIQVMRPLELLCIDFLSIEPDQSNVQNVLVMTDHYTKYAVALPTSNQKAKTVAKCLWDGFIVHYGFPERILSDQGADFESKLIKELCEMAKIHKVRTTPYHPRGNPVEPFNRTLLNMLGTLKEQDKSRWHDFVKPLVHAYNCTKNEVTGFTPYELMFGRQPRLPVDLAFGLPAEKPVHESHSKYVKNLKARLEESYRIATYNASKSAMRNKDRFDKRVRESTFDVGDKVLVRNVRIRGKHKLADKWELSIHTVVERVGDLPVYKVRSQDNAPARVLHKDLLLPCGFLTSEESIPIPSSEKSSKPKTRSQRKRELFNEEQSDSEDEICIFSRIPAGETRITCAYDIKSKEADGKEQDLPQSSDLPQETELPQTVSSPNNVCPPDESLGEVTEMNEPTDSEQETILAGNEIEREYLPSSDRVGDEDEMDMSTGIQDLEERTEQEINTNGESSGNVNPRRSNRIPQPPKKFHYPQLGNPLTSVVQNLFQSLSEAVINSMSLPDLPKVNYILPKS
ncbi:hypothetical protein QQF64_011252 [Cirrhinus molitorella]|uniref:Gypsy retrotransposon integrase-like protein 1 n=1 Tax=Cirrhinus molitorella TaxID=172907 RepID=A0ABR3LYP8_9TELE